MRERDAEGKPVPDWLADAFAVGRRFREVGAKINVLEAEVKTLQANYFEVDFRVEECVRALRKARNILLEDAPYERCECLGKVPGCHICLGRQWISASRYRRPSHLRPRG